MTERAQRWLVIDDDEVFAHTLARALGRRGYQVNQAHTGEAALDAARRQPPDRVVLDLKLDQESGLRILQALKEAQPEVEVVILTGYSSVATAVQAIKLGALNYLCKPARLPEILAAFDAVDEVALENIAEAPPSVERVEWEHIQRVLAENGNNISATARQLGMHRRTLQRKLQKRPVKQ